MNTDFIFSFLILPGDSEIFGNSFKFPVPECFDFFVGSRKRVIFILELFYPGQNFYKFLLALSCKIVSFIKSV